MVVGSITVTHGHCPVGVMHSAANGRASLADGPGVDGTELSDAASTFAFEAAAAHGAPLVAVHTWLDANMTGA
jgi:hypothetical protein